MWELTLADQELLQGLAADEVELTQLKQYFVQYGSEKFVERYPSRAAFFEMHVKEFRKKTRRSQALDSSELHNRIISFLLRMGASKRELDDLLQDVLVKFLRLKFVEKYNPLAAPWSIYLHRGVRNTFITHRTRNKNVFAASAASLDTFTETTLLDSTSNCVHDEILGSEIFESFRNFLRQAPPYRKLQRRRVRWLAELNSPGTPQCPLDQPTLGQVMAINSQTLLVTFPGEKRAYLFPQSLLLELHEPVKELYREVEDCRPAELLDLYTQGFHKSEISTIMQVSVPTLKNWDRTLDELFCKWWSSSPYVDAELKHLGRSRFCPGCKSIIRRLPARETRLAVLEKVQNRNFYKTDPLGCEVEACWCPVCEELSICRAAPGSALKQYFKGNFPWKKKVLSPKDKQRSNSVLSVEVCTDAK